MHTLIIFVAKYAVTIPVLTWIVTLVYLRKERRLKYIVFTLISAVVTILLVKLATSIHTDPRPFVKDGVHPYFTSSTDNGFPSDHTAFSSMLALVVMRYHTKIGTGLMIVALLIGTARVISGVHHGQDIIGGLIIAVIGVGLALLLEKVGRYLRASRSTDK